MREYTNEEYQAILDSCKMRYDMCLKMDKKKKEYNLNIVCVLSNCSHDIGKFTKVIPFHVLMDGITDDDVKAAVQYMNERDTEDREWRAWHAAVDEYDKLPWYKQLFKKYPRIDNFREKE